jgi:hypothetical protein
LGQVPDTRAPQTNRPENFGKELKFGDYVDGLIDEGRPICSKCALGFGKAVF